MQGCLRRQIGRNIAALRERRGWLQKELASRVGATRSGLSKWESGEHTPPVEVLVRMAEVLEVTLDELVQGRPVDGAALGPAERGGGGAGRAEPVAAARPARRIEKELSSGVTKAPDVRTKEVQSWKR